MIPHPPPARSKLMQSIARRHPWLLALAGLLLAAAVAVPVVAFVVVPQFVKSTLVEALPSASAPVASAPANAPAAATPLPAPKPVLAQGTLQRIDPAHFGTGTVSVMEVSGSRFLRFENVNIAGAPDMYVYLSDRTDGKPGIFTNLGKLKATNGSFNYEIPAGLDLAKVHSVVVWCRAFTVSITFAVLQPA